MLSNVPTLSEDDQIPHEAPRNIIEIVSVTDSFQSSQTPVPDGVCAEFCKGFKRIRTPFLLTLLTHAYKSKKLAASFEKKNTQRPDTKERKC